jgi:hypothetical protein
MYLLAAMPGNDHLARIMLQDEVFVQALEGTWTTGLVSPVNTMSFTGAHNVDKGNQPWWVLVGTGAHVAGFNIFGP